MNNEQKNPELDLEILEKMKNDSPLYIYIKTIRGKLGVILFNPLTRRPEERILKGDPKDGKASVDDMTVKIWDESSHAYFKNVNKNLLENGKLVPYNDSKVNEIRMTNAITDEEIDEILNQPYFTLMNRLNEFTSPVPIERILNRAIELNKGIKTLDNIKERLSKMQLEEGLTGSQERLKDYYQNLS